MRQPRRAPHISIICTSAATNRYALTAERPTVSTGSLLAVHPTQTWLYAPIELGGRPFSLRCQRAAKCRLAQRVESARMRTPIQSQRARPPAEFEAARLFPG